MLYEARDFGLEVWKALIAFFELDCLLEICRPIYLSHFQGFECMISNLEDWTELQVVVIDWLELVELLIFLALVSISVVIASEEEGELEVITFEEFLIEL